MASCFATKIGARDTVLSPCPLGAFELDPRNLRLGQSPSVASACVRLKPAAKAGGREASKMFLESRRVEGYWVNLGWVV